MKNRNALRLSAILSVLFLAESIWLYRRHQIQLYGLMIVVGSLWTVVAIQRLARSPRKQTLDAERDKS